MTSDQPLVSIGVPVYNDAPWLRNALDHLLAQDYQNLEIILADDGSSDGSREICREYALRDARVRLFENKHNLGALQNHKFVFDVSAGDYFAWGSGHDYLHPAFVSRLLENLQTNLSVVMCCPQSIFVSENGEILRTTKGGLDTRGLPPVARFEKLLAHLVGGGTANILYGLYRQEALARVDLARQVLGTDVIILGELSLLGEMIQINEVLYHRLDNRAEVNREREQRHAKMIIDAGGFNVDRLMPNVAMLCEYLSMLENSGLSVLEKNDLNAQVYKEAQRIKSYIAEEIKQFIPTSKTELLSLKPYSRVRQYRAAQILSALEQALLFGSVCDGLHQVRAICLAEMRLAAWEQAKARWTEKIQRMLKANLQ